MTNLKNKADLYILSLSLLFLFFIVVTLDIPICFGDHCNFVGWSELMTVNNMVSFVSFLFLLYGVYAYFNFNYALKGTTEVPFKIKGIKSINYEHLTFLATYLIPLISFDFNEPRQMVVLFLLLLFMGVIYVKTDLFYSNPSLALLGFHIYEADGSFKTGTRDGVVIISREKLKKDTRVAYIKLDDRIYYAKNFRSNNGES